MGENTLTKTNVTEFEWDSLLIPEDISKAEEESHSSVVSEYYSRQLSDSSVDLSAIVKEVEVTVDDSLLESEEFEFERSSNDELFTYFQEENTVVDTNILFPRIKRINVLFWFLRNLAKQDISESKIVITNREDVSIIFYQVIESAMFFGFLKRVKEEDETYLIPTDVYEEFINLTFENQYRFFLARLGRNETVSEVIQIQLNDPIYDSISRQMVYNILVNDPNIQKEALSKEEVTKIVNNFRYWYLNIKQAILDN